jgi:hypothetical protein
MALNRLVEVHNPSIIFLQEIMTNGDKVINDLSKILRGLYFSFIDSLGRSGGISLDGKKDHSP